VFDIFTRMHRFAMLDILHHASAVNVKFTFGDGTS
jgi:hypothetical protein